MANVNQKVNKGYFNRVHKITHVATEAIDRDAFMALEKKPLIFKDGNVYRHITENEFNISGMDDDDSAYTTIDDDIIFIVTDHCLSAKHRHQTRNAIQKFWWYSEAIYRRFINPRLTHRQFNRVIPWIILGTPPVAILLVCFIIQFFKYKVL